MRTPRLRTTRLRTTRLRRADQSLYQRLGLAAVAAAVFSLPFVLLMLLVKGKWEPLDRLDVEVAQQLNVFAGRHPDLVQALNQIEGVFSPWAFRAVVLALCAWLWVRGLRRLAVWGVVTMAIGGILGLVLKLLVERARPTFEDPVDFAGGFSFPSGHALNSLLGVAVILLILLPVVPRAWRWLAWLLGAAIVLITAFDRIALGVHYTSDVVAGWVVATACVVATSIAFETWRRERGRRPSNPLEGVEPEAAPQMSDSS